MIDKIKRIFLDGGIYGVAQLAGKLINFLLVPFLSFTMQRSQFGVYTDLFTWVAFLMIVLTFGTETA
jgi:O-antigen/teichoic acid export membrane protein